MTRRERVETAYGLGRPDRIPFAPAIYEHKAIAGDLIATGATQQLWDAGADLDRFFEKTLAARVPFGANIDARLIHGGPPEAIRAAARVVLEKGKDHPGFLFGCGVVAYDCDPAHVLALREALDQAYC